MLKSVIVILFVFTSYGLLGLSVAAEDMLSFNIRLLTLDANEGIAAGDIDGDGVTDLVAGRHWFRGGDWAPRPLRAIEDWNGYIRSNGDYLFDVNKDGRPDVIAGTFLKTEVHWYENPGDEALRLGQMWPRHLLGDTKNSSNEGQMLEDLDGDGRPEWIVNSWSKDVPMMVWRLTPKETASQSSDESAEKTGRQLSIRLYGPPTRGESQRARFGRRRYQRRRKSRRAGRARLVRTTRLRSVVE